jgi:hypothetical protein
MALFQRKIDSIEDMLADIRKSCLYDEGLTKRMVGVLNHDSLLHSDAIEEDTSSLEHLRDLQQAWSFAEKNFDGELTHQFILEVSQKIDPSNFRYRQGSVHISNYDGQFRSGFNPAKVEREMDKLIVHVNDNEDRPVLLRASDLSLYGLFIHPFGDGNGRTFRLLHNLFLYHNGIPPVVIKKAEKRPYKMLVAAADGGFRERSGQEEMFDNPSGGEVQYVGFMLDKVQESAEHLAKKYSKFREYSIDCYFRGSHKQIRGVRDFLRRQTSAGNWEFRSSVARGSKTITVITDAPRPLLDASLYHYSKNKDWFKGFDINSVR